jgi:DNA-binding NarL/FixJ family response regulator
VIRVVVLAADRQVRLELRAALTAPGFDVLADVATINGAETALRSMAPDAVALDPALPGVSAAEACARLSTAQDDVAIILCTTAPDVASVRPALDAGVRALVVRSPGDAGALRSVVRRAVGGETIIDPRATAQPDEPFDRPALSAREQDVLALVGEGLTNAEIGRRLYLSRHTVKEYLSTAMRKLGVSSRVEAALVAAQGGLLARPEPEEGAIGEPAGVTVELVQPGGLSGPADSDISIPVVKLRNG